MSDELANSPFASIYIHQALRKHKVLCQWKGKRQSLARHNTLNTISDPEEEMDSYGENQGKMGFEDLGIWGFELD